MARVCADTHGWQPGGDTHGERYRVYVVHVVFVGLPVGVLWHVFVRTHIGDSRAVAHMTSGTGYVVHIMFVGVTDEVFFGTL